MTTTSPNPAVLLRAAAFAADRHREQRRKGENASPSINHPLSVTAVLADEGDVRVNGHSMRVEARHALACIGVVFQQQSLDLDLSVARNLQFQADLHGLQGTALFLDVDVVIVDDITPFFEQPGDFLIIHDWKRPWRVTGNSSVYRFRLGAHADVLSGFRERVNEVRSQFRNEQAYLSDVMHKQGKLSYWPAPWCASWKYHCIPRFPTNLWREPYIPEGARILIFHGVMNPPDALAGRRNGNWRYARPAPWIAKHWRV